MSANANTKNILSTYETIIKFFNDFMTDAKVNTSTISMTKHRMCW